MSRLGRSDFFWERHIFGRAEGKFRPIGYENQLHAQLYSSMIPCFEWNPADTIKHCHHGGIFNLEFSPDGSILVAATEKRSILVFDPLNHKLINCVPQAHSDCVNYARFLDSRMFATCSDDTTVALWDIRYLRHKIKTLRGHTNWVKNIEYATDQGLLVTSGFDGSIHTWDINKYSENETQYQRVFHTSGLMRMRLTPDHSKMIMCTISGYLMIVHDLDLKTMGADLLGFKPNIYRMIQLGEVAAADSDTFHHVFSSRKNRVELISDFPSENDAEVISSLQVHPYGWCVVSRNTSNDEQSEWTCVHDIQELPKTESLMDESGDKPLVSEEKRAEQVRSSPPPPPLPPPSAEPQGSSRTSARGHEIWLSSGDPMPGGTNERSVVHIRLNYRPRMQGDPRLRAVPHGLYSTTERFRLGSIEVRISRPRIAGSSSASTSGNVSGEVSSLSQQTLPNMPDRHSLQAESARVLSRTLEGSNENADGSNGNQNDEAASSPPRSFLRDGSAFFIRTGSEQGGHTLLVLGPTRPFPPTQASNSHRVHQNNRRLMYYIEEPNLGRGFIKEQCFSTDGRLICSPYGYGVRLLSVRPDCCEMCDCEPKSPTKLHEVAIRSPHTNYVVSTKFSPVHCLLVSGCLDGKLCFHQPVI